MGRRQIVRSKKRSSLAALWPKRHYTPSLGTQYAMGFDLASPFNVMSFCRGLKPCNIA